MNRIAWHYTIARHFWQIMNDGFLRPTAIGADPGERSVTWFSMAPYFEQSARKGIFENGRRRTCTLKEMRAAGLYRFGIDERRLIAWPKVGHEAGIADIQGLTQAGRKMGADPTQWRGAFDALPVGDLIAQRMNDSAEWEDFKAAAPLYCFRSPGLVP